MNIGEWMRFQFCFLKRLVNDNLEFGSICGMLFYVEGCNNRFGIIKFFGFFIGMIFKFISQFEQMNFRRKIIKNVEI